MNIDIRTVLIFLILTYLLQVIALFAQYRVNKTHCGLGWWTLGSLTCALGFVFYYMRDYPVIAPIAIVINNILFVGGALLFYVGVLRFFNRRERPEWLVVFCALASLIAVYFTYVDDNLAVRVANNSLALAIVAFLIARALFAYRTHPVTTSASFLAVVFLTCGILLVMRALSILFIPVGDLFSPTLAQALTFLVGLVTSTLWTFGFIILVNQRLNAQNLEARERFELIFDTSPDAVLICRLDDGLILDANRGFAALSGHSREELTGKCSTDLDMWENPAERRKFMNELREKGSCENFETIFHQGEGGKLVVILSARIISLYGVPHALTVIRDITERKRAEEEHRKLELRLQRAEKMEALGTLAGGVAHDLNNVLGIIVGYSEMLLHELEDASQGKSHATKILKGGQRAAAIVQDLLTLARRGVPNTKVLNLNGTVRDCQESPEFMKLSSSQANLRIDTCLEADLLNVSGSPVHLGKSLMNLMSNAVEAMPDGGVLTVRTANCYLDKPISGYDEVREGDYVVLTMSDTGEGIAPEDLKRIFEPFYTKKVMGRSGTGLGLAVVWGTVKDHRGYINVESEEGKGTTFTLYFPVTRERITPEQIAISASEFVGNGETILVVDDVKEQRELAMMMLTKLNYRVSSARSGEEAVEHLRREAVDLVVLDMIMDGMDGLDTYIKILEINPRQKAIIVSGYSETERVSRAQALGAGPYVQKPYILERLGQAVRSELGPVNMSAGRLASNNAKPRETGTGF
ncbi:MAG: ATP-binding protein [Syntrophobacter sp.]